MKRARLKRKAKLKNKKPRITRAQRIEVEAVIERARHPIEGYVMCEEEGCGHNGTIYPLQVAHRKGRGAEGWHRDNMNILCAKHHSELDHGNGMPYLAFI